jgi:hypothetical protein
MTAGGGDRGTFTLWEASVAGVPESTCNSPTDWSGGAAGAQTLNMVDWVNLNGNAENDEGISAAISSPPGTSISVAYMCFTPLGRSYLSTGTAATNQAVGAANPGATKIVFNGLLPNAIPIEVDVTNATNTSTLRSVLVPPTGVARLFSHTP